MVLISQLGASRKKLGRICWGCSDESSSSSSEDSFVVDGGICDCLIAPVGGGSNRLIGFEGGVWLPGGGGGGGGGTDGGLEGAGRDGRAESLGGCGGGGFKGSIEPAKRRFRSD